MEKRVEPPADGEPAFGHPVFRVAGFVAVYWYLSKDVARLARADGFEESELIRIIGIVVGILLLYHAASGEWMTRPSPSSPRSRSAP